MNFKSLFFCLLLSGCVFAANDVMNTQTQNTVTRNTEISSTSDNPAHTWDLTQGEWKRYQILMQGQAGYYYPHLTPPEVLGHYAKDAEEMQYFAEIHARQEHDRIEREIKFDKAFHLAAHKLYADEPIIRPFDMSAFTPVPNNAASH